MKLTLTLTLLFTALLSVVYAQQRLSPCPETNTTWPYPGTFRIRLWKTSVITVVRPWQHNDVIAIKSGGHYELIVNTTATYATVPREQRAQFLFKDSVLSLAVDGKKLPGYHQGGLSPFAFGRTRDPAGLETVVGCGESFPTQVMSAWLHDQDKLVMCTAKSPSQEGIWKVYSTPESAPANCEKIYLQISCPGCIGVTELEGPEPKE